MFKYLICSRCVYFNQKRASVCSVVRGVSFRVPIFQLLDCIVCTLQAIPRWVEVGDS